MKTAMLTLIALAALSAALGASGAAAASVDYHGNPTDGSYGVGAGCFDGSVTTDNPDVSYTQAGGHPFALTTSIAINTQTDSPYGNPWPEEPTRDVLVDAPPGLLGNPSAAARCTMEELASRLGCPTASQVGTAIVTHTACQAPGLCVPLVSTPAVFNMAAPPGAPARLGFVVVQTIIVLDAEVRSGSDYGVSVNARNIPEALPVIETSLTLWGVPADPAHDFERRCQQVGDPLGCPAGVPPQAFLRLPTACAGPQIATVHTDSWFHPGIFADASFTSHATAAEGGAPIGVTGCDQVPFDPTISVQPTSHQADSPTGLNVDLTIPQDQLSNPDAIAQSDLKQAVVTLPAGMSVNPSSADGLGACTAAQIDLKGQNTEPNCPDSSKIGSVEIVTPLLDHPIPGAVYLAKQGDNPFNSLLALYIVGDDPQSGVIVKLAGHVEADPNTGQLTTTFDNQPQLPFSSLHLELKGGNRAPLINPPACGSYAIHSQLTPWSSNGAVDLSSPFQITSGPGGGACPNQGALSPSLQAGLTNPIAAQTGDFVFKLTRGDAQQRLKTLDVRTPPGIAAYLKGVPYCPDAVLDSAALAQRLGAAELASPSCPAASQIGRLTVGVGPGAPFYVNTGKVYLAGPYQGAPLSIAVLVPALAGPFDLGTVLVRSPVQVDPLDAHLSVHAELPTILQGIPLDVRSVDLSIDRPNFILGPTNCSKMSIDARVGGTAGASASASSPFQMTDCAALGFKPKLSLHLKGGTKRGDHPKLIATATARQGDANIDRVSVALPHSEFLDQAHIGTVCTRVQFASDSCPAGSIYGYAKARTPLLDQPLQGPVYLRSSSNPLPDLVAALHGQVDVDLAGRIDSVNGGIRNTFEVVPDAPVTKFTLQMKGGKKGLLVNSRNLCASTNRANVQIDGQNGKTADQRPQLKSDCGKAKRKGKRKSH